MHFGTDGIRGRVDDAITEELAYQFGFAVATVFRELPCFVGYDTRESSPRLANAAIAGVSDGGEDVTNLGVLTTPGVARVAALRAGIGVVVSASHNPYFDNGLKVLGVGGSKLDLETEGRVQRALEGAPATPGPYDDLPIDHTAAATYVDQLRSLIPENALSGLRLVLDCANGAASELAPELFRSRGATVEVIHAAPSGTNINENCGSTHPEDLQRAVTTSGAHLGLAFDGDADRLVAVDESGVVRNGDDLLVLFALDLASRGELGRGIAVTTLSNLGLHHAMRASHIDVVETDVGDRAVLMALLEHDLLLGGEQSGHLIFRDHSVSGDGMLTGLLLADLVKRKGSLRELSESAWRRTPQQLINFPNDEFDAEIVARTQREVVELFALSPDEYRILVRPSGTEPVVRVMVEALNSDFVTTFVQRVAQSHVSRE